MANTDNNSPPTLSGILSALFSPGTLAALRYALAAVAPLLTIFGFAGLTPTKIDVIVQYAQTFGIAALALLSLLGVVFPLMMAVIGVLTSTVKKQIDRVRELATNPELANEEAQKAIVAATRAIASAGVSQSASAVQSLVDTTISLPQVKTIITSDNVANASPSPSVISEKKAEVLVQ